MVEIMEWLLGYLKLFLYGLVHFITYLDLQVKQTPFHHSSTIACINLS